MTRARKALALVGYALLVVGLLAWVLFAVFLLHPWYVREFGTW